MTPPIARIPGQRANPRYEALLHERIAKGQDVADALSHREHHDLAMSLWRQANQLDRQLQRFRRYSADYLTKVAFAEDARFHVPPATPVDHAQRPCTWCLHGFLELDRAVVLLSSTRRSA